MAQDKRHDFAPHTLRLWIDKLDGYPDAVICRAMRQGRWDYFPSVDDVLNVADEIREQVPSSFVPCGECVNGWKVVEVESNFYTSKKAHKAVRCKCWHEWSGMTV